VANQKRKRRQLFVDREVQGALVLRAAGYWLFCLLTVTLMVLCWGVLTGPRAPATVVLGRLLSNYAPALLASLILLPIVLVDCTRFSNRFVGPLVRFRRSLRQLADGQDVRPIKYRDNDYWQDLAEGYNDLLKRMQSPPVAEMDDAGSSRSPSVETAESAEENEAVVCC
jgi:hypothetical protein